MMEWIAYFAIAVVIVGGIYLLRKSSSIVTGIFNAIDSFLL